MVSSTEKEVCLLVAENNLDAVGRLVVSGQVSENEQLVTYKTWGNGIVISSLNLNQMSCKRRCFGCSSQVHQELSFASD